VGDDGRDLGLPRARDEQVGTKNRRALDDRVSLFLASHIASKRYLVQDEQRKPLMSSLYGGIATGVDSILGRSLNVCDYEKLNRSPPCLES
jgi:hypothetical protein